MLLSSSSAWTVNSTGWIKQHCECDAHTVACSQRSTSWQLGSVLVHCTWLPTLHVQASSLDCIPVLQVVWQHVWCPLDAWFGSETRARQPLCFCMLQSARQHISWAAGTLGAVSWCLRSSRKPFWSAIWCTQTWRHPQTWAVPPARVDMAFTPRE